VHIRSEWHQRDGEIIEGDICLKPGRSLTEKAFFDWCRHPSAAREDWGVADSAAAGSTAAAGAEGRARCQVSSQKPQRRKNR